jgi:hypothetical protein
MRALIIVPLCLAAACSGGGGENKAAQAADAMQPGQWEIGSEVAAFRSMDKAVPVLKAAVGDKSTATACIEPGKEAKPPPEMFAGAGYECDYKDTYLSAGRMVVSMECERGGVNGKINVAVEGNYTGDSFQATASTASLLPGEGDFEMSRKLTGRRTGPACAAPAAGSPKGKAKA